MIKEGYLKVSDGHGIYYATAGEGIPLLKIHGGPGGSCKLDFFNEIDLTKYKAIVFDQRGCGKSIYDNDILDGNNTNNLIEDINLLLEHLNIKKTVIAASSWGACLGLLFAEKYPEKILKMFLNSVFIEENSWFLEYSKFLFPDIYDKYMSIIPNDFGKILKSDEEKFKEYAKNITNYELNLMAQTCTGKEYIKEIDEELLNSKKIFLHYECNNCFMSENQIINNADKIKNIPINIYHGRLDLLCPLLNVYNLCKKLNNADLTIVPYENHCGPLLKQLSYKEINNYSRSKYETTKLADLYRSK